jgi:hypothetical protein
MSSGHHCEDLANAGFEEYRWPCEHPKLMIAQNADQQKWSIFCVDCNLHGPKGSSRKAAERKWLAMVKAQTAWRQK